MKRFAFVLALLAALALVVIPVAPCFAASSAESQIEQSAYRGHIIALTGRQLIALQKSYPSLYRKIMAARGHPPQLTTAEAAIVAPMTMTTLRQIKAGQQTGSSPSPSQGSSGSGNSQQSTPPLEMAACFTAAAALLAIVPPFGYIAAGVVFAACVVFFFPEVQALLQKWLNLPAPSESKT